MQLNIIQDDLTFNNKINSNYYSELSSRNVLGHFDLPTSANERLYLGLIHEQIHNISMILIKNKAFMLHHMLNEITIYIRLINNMLYNTSSNIISDIVNENNDELEEKYDDFEYGNTITIPVNPSIYYIDYVNNYLLTTSEYLSEEKIALLLQKTSIHCDLENLIKSKKLNSIVLLNRINSITDHYDYFINNLML